MGLGGDIFSVVVFGIKNGGVVGGGNFIFSLQSLLPFSFRLLPNLPIIPRYNYHIHQLNAVIIIIVILKLKPHQIIPNLI